MLKFKFLVPVIFILPFFLSSCKQEVPTPTKPNILFIFADDHCFNSVNSLGDKQLITPNLDKLVNQGTNFTNTFNMGGWNGAVCIASRTMLNTGKFIWDAFRADSLMRKNNYQTPFWSELLEEAGYDTYMSGKWHVAKSPESIFQNVIHPRPGMPNQTESGYNRPQNQHDTIWKPWDTSREGFWKGGKHWSEVLADDAISFLDSASTKDSPFFMYIAFNAPHDPRQSPESFVNKYPVENIKVPENFLAEYPYNEAMGSGRTLRDERLAPFPRTHYAVQVNRQEYFAIITHMDEQIGKILDALEASGQKEDTYVIFSADHGLSVGQHGLLGKQNMYDHSIRVPMMILGPDIPGNKAVTTDVYVQDIMPTVLEMAGVQKPEFVDFQSLLPLAHGKQADQYSAIYGAYTMKQRMIRSNGFKLIAYPHAKKLRLFDLEKDPLEMNDLSDVAEYKEKKQQLWQELLALQKNMNDPLDLESYFILKEEQSHD